MPYSLFFAAALIASTSSLAAAGPVDPPPPASCSCPSGSDQLLDQIDHVFIGDLIQIKDDGDDGTIAVIKVRENFKGDLSGVVDVRDALATKCSWAVFEMALPGRYMVFANDDEGELVTPAFCPQTQPLSGWKDRLAPFRAYARTHRSAPAPAPKPSSN